MSEEKTLVMITYISQRCGLPEDMVLDLIQRGWKFREEYNQPPRFVAPMPNIQARPALKPMTYQIQPVSGEAINGTRR